MTPFFRLFRFHWKETSQEHACSSFGRKRRPALFAGSVRLVVMAGALYGATMAVTHFAVASRMGPSPQEERASDAASEPVEWSALLPSGDGQLQIGVYCTVCHNLKSTVCDRRTDLNGWTELVERMAFTHEAPIPDEDIPVISTYLSQHYGPTVPKVEIPVKINTASKEILSVILELKEVEKLLETRAKGKIKDLAELEGIIGKVKASHIRGIISLNE